MLDNGSAAAPGRVALGVDACGLCIVCVRVGLFVVVVCFVSSFTGMDAVKYQDERFYILYFISSHFFL
jgi:hypothetical protein